MTFDTDVFDLRFKNAAAGLGLTKTGADVVDGVAPEDNDTVIEDDDDVTDVEVEEEQDTPLPDVNVASEDDKTRRVQVSNFFSHPDSHPIILDLLLLQKYGPEWFDWEHETLELRVQHDFGQAVSELNMHKIQAAKTLHFIDTYWKEWHVFCWVTMAFNGLYPDFEVMQVPTVAQAMVSVDIANRIRQDVPFSQELNDFLEQVQMHDGIFVPIEPLTFVTMDDVDDYVVDVEEVKNRWPDVRTSGRAPKGDTVTDEQLRRMLDVREILEESRQELKEQLRLVARG
jgi:hypothetical protein